MLKEYILRTCVDVHRIDRNYCWNLEYFNNKMFEIIRLGLPAAPHTHTHTHTQIIIVAYVPTSVLVLFQQIDLCRVFV